MLTRKFLLVISSLTIWQNTQRNYKCVYAPGTPHPICLQILFASITAFCSTWKLFLCIDSLKCVFRNKPSTQIHTHTHTKQTYLLRTLPLKLNLLHLTNLDRFHDICSLYEIIYVLTYKLNQYDNLICAENFEMLT